MRRNVATLTSLLLSAAWSSRDPEPAADTNPPADADPAQATPSIERSSQANDKDGAGDA